MIPELQKTGVSLKRAILCLGVAAWTPAMAIPVTVEFAGTIDPSSPLGPVGSGFSGALTYESDTPALFTGPSEYIYAGAVSSFQLVTSIGTFSGDSVENNIALRNDQCLPPTHLVCQDSFTANGELSDATASYDSGLFQFTLFDSELVATGAPSLLSEHSSLPTDLNLAGLDGGRVFMRLDGESVDIFRGTISSLEATSVPEPATLSLLATGVFGLGLAGWRRRLRSRNQG